MKHLCAALLMVAGCQDGPSGVAPLDDDGGAPLGLTAGADLSTPESPDLAIPEQTPILAQLVQTTDAYLQANETSDGITPPPSPTPELTRLSVIPQLLGYYSLNQKNPSTRYAKDISDRTAYLVNNLSTVASGGDFDGMGAYALYCAYEIDQQQATLDAANQMLTPCYRATPNSSAQNGDLMCAMGLAKKFALTGDADAKAWANKRVSKVLNSQGRYVAGGYSHVYVCQNSTVDLQYTDWMYMEATLIRPLLHSSALDQSLASQASLLAGQITATGEPSYTDANGTLYFSNFCDRDYDTRYWNNELAYDALAFDDQGSAMNLQYNLVLSFLAAQQGADGGFPDHWNVPGEAESVIRTSLIFWILATVEAAH